MKGIKKQIAIVLSVIMVLTMIPGQAFAATGDIGTYKPYTEATYELTYEELADGTLSVTGYTGDAKGKLVIPESIDGKKVTVIGQGAFTDCKEFTGELVLPKTLKAIGGTSYTSSDGAFYGCSGLTGDLIIPKGVTTIGKDAFYGCSGFTGKLSIPEGVLTIDKYAFTACSGLIGDLTIPKGVTTIGDNAFKECSGFTGKLTIPEEITNIGNGTFDNCSGLTGELNIPKGVNKIGAFAFARCSGLTGDLTIPEGVTQIGNEAFSGCRGFSGNLIIPKGVTTINEFTFYGCSGLTGKLTIPKGVTTIGNGAFYGCSGLTGNLIIPESVTTIGDSAFARCSELTGKLTIPKGVTTIGEYVFYGCSGFTGNIVIPEGTKTISNGLFKDCSGLTGNLIIPEGVTTIGEEAFVGCQGLSGNVVLPKSVQSIGEFALGDPINNIYYQGTEKEWDVVEGRPQNVSGKTYFNIKDHVFLNAVTNLDSRLARVSGGYNDVVLSWDELKGVDGYNIYYRRPAKTDAWTSLAQVTATTYTKKDLYAGWRYEFKVIPYVMNSGKKLEGDSAVTEIVTGKLAKAPTAMTSRLAIGTGAYDDIYTYWSKGINADGYYVYYRRPSKTTKWTYLGLTTKTSYLKKDLYDGYKYEFKIIPYNYADGCRFKGTSYKISSATTLKKVNMPVIKKYATGKVKVSWNNIYGESGYQISRSTSKTGTYIVSTYTTTKGTYKTLNTLKNKRYYYKVRAFKNVTKNGKTVRVYAPWSDARSFTLR